MGNTIKHLIEDIELVEQQMKIVQSKKGMDYDFFDAAEQFEIDNIKDLAAEGYYHDFITPVATPKMELVKDMPVLDVTVTNGVRDSPQAPSREHLPNSKRNSWV